MTKLEDLSVPVKSVIAAFIAISPFVFWLFTVSATSTNAQGSSNRANERIDEFMEKRERNREEYFKTLNSINERLGRIEERLRIQPTTKGI